MRPHLEVIEGGLGKPEPEPREPLAAYRKATAEELADMARRNEGLRVAREAKKARLEAAPHSIYRLYDVDGLLLYVGISLNGPGRMKQHAGSKDWWQQVTRIEVDHVMGREAAETRELELIRKLDPLWNIRGKEAS